MSDQRGDTPVKNWLRYLKKLNLLKSLKIVLIENTTKELRYDREAHWTKFLGATLNAKVGVSHTEEHKAYMSRLLKGRKHTAATLAKMKKAKLKTAKKVEVNNIVYESIQSASKITGISAGLICSVSSGQRVSKKYKIKYA